MTIYEHDDDLGLNKDYTSKAEGNAGIEIACCNIKRLGFAWMTAAGIEIGDIDSSTHGRVLSSLLDDDDYFTDEHYRELFGFEIDEDDLSFLQD